MKKRLFYITSFLFAWFTIHSVTIIIDGLRDETDKSDIGIILGNKVDADGTVSERLAKRLDKGIELYNNSVIDFIFVSGGLGKEGYYEGTKMSEYLSERGIPKDKIIIDNDGNTTAATAENFRKLNLNVSSVTVITQYYHITRTKLAFKKHGYNTVRGVHADFFELRDVYSIVREFFGYYKYLLMIIRF